jgi:transposase
MDKTGEIKRKRSQRDYDLGFKLALVEPSRKGELTYKQAQKQYGIQGRRIALVRLRKHGRVDWKILIKQPFLIQKRRRHS